MPEKTTKPLSHLLALISDRTGGKKDSSRPYVGLEHIPSAGSSLLTVGNAIDSISTNGLFAAGDILFGKLRPRLRKSIRAKVSGYCSTDILVLRPTGNVDPAFAGFVSQSDAVFLAAIRTEEGTKMPRCSWRDLKAVDVFCPFEKTAQLKIAAILTSIDTAIEKTETLIAKYQQIKAGLMHDLFTRGVLPNGQLRPPREQAPELYQETAIGWLPKGWAIVRMIGLAEDRKGSTTIGPFGSDLVATDYRLEGVPIVFVRDVKESGFQWNSDTYVSPQKARQLAAHRVASGEVLATKMGLPPCVSCLYPDWMPAGVITADMIRLSPDQKNVNGYWLTTAINHDSVKRQIAGITAGVTRPKVTLSDFRNIRIAKPTKEEQERISSRLQAAQEVIGAELIRVGKLQAQKLGLMQDLLTGKVQVKVHEPTPELLHA